MPLQQSPDQFTIPLIVDPLSLSPRYNRNLKADLQYSMPLPIAVPSSGNYWSVALIKAFDPDQLDLDPPDKVILKGIPPRPVRGFDLGYTTIGPLSGLFSKIRSVVFVETLRDLYEKPPSYLSTILRAPGALNPDFRTTVRRVAAHEIMHSLSIPHGASNLMCANVNLTADPMGDQLNDDQVSMVRRISAPTYPAVDFTCP